MINSNQNTDISNSDYIISDEILDMILDELQIGYMDYEIDDSYEMAVIEPFSYKR